MAGLVACRCVAGNGLPSRIASVIIPWLPAAYLAFYLAFWSMAISGLALAAIEQGRGPLVAGSATTCPAEALFGMPHDVLEEFVWGFVVFAYRRADPA
jgi:hypothetical protein